MPQLSSKPVQLGGAKKVEQVPQPTSQWVKKRIRIRGINNIDMEIDGMCLGALVIHKHMVYPDKYTNLSHRPSGFFILVAEKEEDTYKMGDYLWSKFRLIIQLPTKNEVLWQCPLWLRRWIKYCHKNHRFMPPEPFQQNKE